MTCGTFHTLSKAIFEGFVEIYFRMLTEQYPANTQRWFNVEICWNNVATLVNVISTLIQRWFITVDSTVKFNVDFALTLKDIFFLYHDIRFEKLKNYNLYINVEKITVFQRQNNVILSTLNQRWNLTLKQRWFWVDTENRFILMS